MTPVATDACRLGAAKRDCSFDLGRHAPVPDRKESHVFTTSKHTLKVASLAAAIALPLSFAACSSSEPGTPAPSSSASGTTSASTEPTTAPTASPGPTASAGASEATNATFGSGCAAVPTTGAGSFDQMSGLPVASAASDNPLLTTLVTAVKASGLVDTLNNASNITVFAPTDDAFKAVNQAASRQGRGSLPLIAGSYKTLSWGDHHCGGIRRGLHRRRKGQGDLWKRADRQRHGLHHRPGARRRFVIVDPEPAPGQ